MSNPFHKAFTYLRVSTKIQSEKGTEATQRMVLQKYAQEHNIDIVEEFFDDASGKDLNRPRMQEMLTRLNEVECILVYDQDRLTRDTKDLIILSEIFLDAKIDVIGVVDPINFQSEYGQFIAEIKASLHKMERLRTNRKIKDGIQRRKKEKGFWGRKPKINERNFRYWYEKKDIKNISVLGQILGVHRNTVYAFMKKHNIDYKNRTRKILNV